MKKFLKVGIYLGLIYTSYLPGVKAQAVVQVEELKIGKKFPYFELSGIDHYKQTKITSADLLGKWIVLDFWSEWCGSCVKSIPKINSMQSWFENEVEFFMIGTYLDSKTSNIATTKRLYDKIIKQINGSLPVSYDNDFAGKLNVTRLPDIFVIDPKGILRSRVGQLTPESLKSIIQGESAEIEDEAPSYEEQRRRNRSYNLKSPILVNGNGGDDSSFIYRSVIVPNNRFSRTFAEVYKNGRIEIISATLGSLYQFAYLGQSNWNIHSKDLYEKYFLDPVLEVRDSSKFYSSTGLENKYSYSLCYPKTDSAAKFVNYSFEANPQLRKKMQGDMESCFGYKVFLENREMPIYKLVLLNANAAKIKSKGKSKGFIKSSAQYQGAVIQNLPVSSILEYIYFHTIDYKKAIPLIDETNVDFNIDIKLNGTTMLEIVESLRKNGLNLKLDMIEMKCIVIKDPVP